MEVKKMTDQFGTTDITSDDKLWALLSYILTPIVPIILLLMEDKKNRPFLKYHGMQALVWGIILYVVCIILSFIVIGLCLWVIGGIITIYWGIKAYQGEWVKIPLITDFVKNQGWV
jgi:uncharacterized membrane protein